MKKEKIVSTRSVKGINKNIIVNFDEIWLNMCRTGRDTSFGCKNAVFHLKNWNRVKLYQQKYKGYGQEHNGLLRRIIMLMNILLPGNMAFQYLTRCWKFWSLNKPIIIMWNTTYTIKNKLPRIKIPSRTSLITRLLPKSQHQLPSLSSIFSMTLRIKKT